MHSVQHVGVGSLREAKTSVQNRPTFGFLSGIATRID
jgi:hypothetical protein